MSQLKTDVLESLSYETVQHMQVWKEKKTNMMMMMMMMMIKTC